MAYIQKTLPPPNKVLNFSLKSFSGGLNNRSEILEPNQASDLLNMRFANDTIMEKRYGTQYYNEFICDEPVVFVHEYRPYKGEDKLIKATPTKLYVDNEFLMDIGGQISGINFRGRFYFTDGNKMYVYGTFPHAESTYEKIVGTNTEDALHVLEVVSPPDAHAKLDSSHVQGVTRFNFTDKKVHYEPCQLEFDDPYKGANVLPEQTQYMVGHKGRLFLSGALEDDDNTFISDVSNPYYFPTSLPMQIPPNSDKVIGMAVYEDSVVIGRRYDIYVINGVTNNPTLGEQIFTLKKLNTHTGFANHEAVNVAHNYLFYLGSDGHAYHLASTRDTENLVTTLLSRTIDFFAPPVDLENASIYDACSIFYKNEWYLSIGDKVFVYSYIQRAWTMYNNLDIRSFYQIKDELIWGTEHGRLVHFSKEYLDLGYPFEAHWTSQWFDMEDANSHKQFREFFLVAYTFDDFKSDIRVNFEIDYVDVNSNISIANQVSIWGRAIWGDRFITRNINASLPFVIGRRGRSIRFTFSNSYFPGNTVETPNDLKAYLERHEGVLSYVNSEESYYLFTEGAWKKVNMDDLNQPMKVYQVNGEYELRGKR